MIFRTKFALLFLLVAVFCAHYCATKEVQATHEWTLLGENDTVAAGMHIRMNLETGEKFVKLPDEDNDKPDRVQSVDAQVTAEGGLILTESREDTDDENSQQQQQQQQEPDYNFEMMHRTLSQLPEDEKKQLQLPDLPGGTTASPAERQAFEARMKQIWEMRQEQLRQFQETHVADLPEILKDRIRRIQDYLQDPVGHLRAMQSDNQNTNNAVTNIIDVLQDLEYQLADVDMTRDFYTLGGWPLLVTLLADPANATTIMTDDDLWEEVYNVQAHAAWVVGTAVKNTNEFAAYALEPVGPQQMTALDLVLQQYVHTDSTSTTAILNKNHKLLYGLGSMLRGNRPAQVHFCRAGGPALLATKLRQTVENGQDFKSMQRLLALALDIVTDVKLHASKSTQVDAAIVASFASDAWCHSVLKALQVDHVAVQEKALRTMQTLVGHCQWDTNTVQTAVKQVETQWKATAENRDPEVQEELLNLVDSTIKVI